MVLLRRAVVSILVACLCGSATAAELIAGPWVLLTPDGGVRIGAEWSQSVAITPQAELEVDGRFLRLPQEQRPCQRRTGETTSIVDLVMEPTARQAGLFRWKLNGRTLAGRLPDPTIDAGHTRLAVVGALNYPSGPDLGRLATQLDGPIDAVVVVGPDRQRSVGRGGWEHAIPIVLLGSGPAEDDRALESFAPTSRWRRGLVRGCLGLPNTRPDGDWAAAIAAELCPWRVPVIGEGMWDPGVLAPVERVESGALRPLISLAAGLQVPVILQCGGRAGFISEPLLDDRGTLRSAGGGVRVLGATPSGEALAGLSEDIAAPVPGTAIVGLHATPTDLLLAVVGGEDPPITMAWNRTVDGVVGGPGSGSGDVLVAWRAWRDGDADRLADAAWAAIPGMQRVALTREDVESLIAAAGSGLGRIAARRYLGRPDGGPLPENAPDWLVRERALRELGRRAVSPGGTAAIALVSGTDGDVLHAAVRCLDGSQRDLILDLLVERLRRFSESGAPDIADPLLRHRVISAVFDAADRSPTPLRPLAVALRPRLDGLALGPVERFLKRYGEIRR